MSRARFEGSGRGHLKAKKVKLCGACVLSHNRQTNGDNYVELRDLRHPAGCVVCSVFVLPYTLFKNLVSWTSGFLLDEVEVASSSFSTTNQVLYPAEISGLFSNIELTRCLAWVG